MLSKTVLIFRALEMSWYMPGRYWINTVIICTQLSVAISPTQLMLNEFLQNDFSFIWTKAVLFSIRLSSRSQPAARSPGPRRLNKQLNRSNTLIWVPMRRIDYRRLRSLALGSSWGEGRRCYYFNSKHDGNATVELLIWTTILTNFCGVYYICWVLNPACIHFFLCMLQRGDYLSPSN